MEGTNFVNDNWCLDCEWYREYVACPCKYISHLNIGGVEMQEHFVNIGNV